ncbi:hypothetical protein Psfp_03827 [Pelotomaculum sp. FP]|uniref:hypothetical protein n=1 Tax=Pelotomaculum sp. FP TaxID=261474 RepID=UPI001066D42F|nr:hypothetical protein [Pelotomaculum sp. FP]TEB11993.1 hypothetical protein Psfp_03827 [Pelotomaculum sp. FP]
MRRTNIKAVLKIIRMYLDGKISRIDLILDFPDELEKRYEKMRLEDWEYAELIYDRLLEDGICGDDLSDEDFRDLMNDQYKDVLDIASKGFA